MSFTVPSPIRHPAALGLGIALSLAACSGPTPAPGDAQSPTAAAQAPVVQTPAAVEPKVEPGMAPRELVEAELGAPTMASSLCFPGRLDGSKLTPRPTRVRNRAAAGFDGWVGDEATMARPESPMLRFVQIDGPRAWELPLVEVVNRPDVVRVVGAETLRSSGFKVLADLSSLPAGDYHLVVTFERDGKQFVCDKSRMIRLGR